MIGFTRRNVFYSTVLLFATSTNAFLSQQPATPGILRTVRTTHGHNDKSKLPLKRVSRQHPFPWLHRSGGIQLGSNAKRYRDEEKNDAFFDRETTASLVGLQSLLILASICIAALVGTPKLGLGPGFDLSWPAFSMGVLYTLPLGLLAAALDIVEDKFPVLQDVTKATQRFVLELLGGKFKPGIAFVTSLALGCVAGVGEEMLFRGVLQHELTSRLGQGVAVVLSSVLFGALHAVTPLYAILAGLSGVYFGAIYIVSSNLAVPIATHAVYDLLALMYAHWTVSRLSVDEQTDLSQWQGPGDGSLNQK